MKADTDFAARLLAAARPSPIESMPFVREVVAGRLPAETVAAYLQGLAEMAMRFPARIAAVLTICDDRDVRLALIANLLEEEGVTRFEPGAGGLRYDESRRHGTMAARLAQAGGVKSEAESATPASNPWFDEVVLAGDWPAAFAYFAIGFEANVPATFRLLIPPLRDHYGYSDDTLEFMTEHCSADERHGIESAHLIARTVRTSAQRDSALEGARRGGVAWLAFHKAYARRAALAAQ